MKFNSGQSSNNLLPPRNNDLTIGQAQRMCGRWLYTYQ